MNPLPPILACTGSLQLGGSTTFLLNLGRNFRERGMQFPVVSMAPENEMAGDFSSAGISVTTLPTRGLIYEDRIVRAYQAVAPQRPAAVLASLGSESFELLRLVPPGVKRFGVIQSDDPAPFEMTRHFVPWLDVLVGVSDRICRRLREDPAFGKTRIECIPYGIAFGPQEPRPPRDPSQPIRLLYLGRIIEEQKRVSRFVDLCKILAGRGVSFEFTIAGGGPDLPKIRQQLAPFSNVRCIGEVPNATTRSLFRDHDIFVLLSDYEGLPLSLLEAMGEGVVPMVSDLESGMREVVLADVGLRVPVGDLDAAAGAIAHLAQDPGKLRAMSDAAMRRARDEYSAARMAGRYLELAGVPPANAPAWPATVQMPRPLILKDGWMYSGMARRARRILKSLSLVAAI